jgi:hypothetical protein
MLRLIASGSAAPRGFGQGSFFARPLRAADVPDYIAALEGGAARHVA